MARGAQRDTQLREPVRVVFDWSVDESGVRAQGRGVARMEPPYHARLDLFARNGETVARAALVDDLLRLPPGAPGVPIPPPPLLWAALGVFRPGDHAALLGGEAGGQGEVVLRYGFADGREVRFRLRDQRLVQAEVLRRGQVVERVTVGRAGNGRFPSEATYRNLPEFRELRVTLDSLEHVESFPPDIWDPPR